MATATDVCDADVTVTVASATAAGSCPGETVVTRTFTATDDCGNTATATQVVTFEDVTAPVLADVPADADLACDGAAPTALPTATDDCGGAVAVTAAETDVTGDCASGRRVTRVFTATDACGNTATASQVVTYRDTGAPAFASVPADLTLDCGDAEPTDMATATDACDAERRP